ncbi:hypothetical protein Lalb_Chr19g0126901 [Lupinus albus]|uniref:Uncharacterized protein n=1 Tax=Lupinus albus TaxID=3870 RepID=A0A6A4NY10_LUPAL|nr:hypothetical protein Lalb_Chr19g0126901 [Lupinus albus]
MYLNLLSPTKGYDQPCLLNSRDFHNVSIKYKYHTKILSFDHLNPTRKYIIFLLYKHTHQPLW